MSRYVAPTVVPAGTHLSLSVTAPLASNVAKAGDAFAYVIDDDLIVNGVVVVRKGATGGGTVTFAGAAGSHGQEGNLHLRFETLPTTLGNAMPVNTELEIDGKKQKLLGKLSGVTWMTGFGQAVRGGQAVVTPADVLDVVLATPACIAAPSGTACPPSSGLN